MAGDRSGIMQDLPDTVTGRGLATGMPAFRGFGLGTPTTAAHQPAIMPAQGSRFNFGGNGNNFSPHPFRPPTPTPQPHPTPTPTPPPTTAPPPSGGTPAPSTNPPPGQSAKVGSGAFIPPPMTTTHSTNPQEGDVFSWDFPTASATPKPAPGTPAPDTGGNQGGNQGGNWPLGRNFIPNFGSMSPGAKHGLATDLGLPQAGANNPFVQAGFMPATAQPITPSILRQNGYTPGGVYGPRGDRAAGGGVMPGGGGPSNAFMEKGVVKDSESTFHHSGLVHSPVAGRTDRLPVSVPAGAYVIPADVVSGLGEGNTLAGAKVLDRMMHSGPFGTTPMAGRSGGHGIPGYPAGPVKAMGGEVAGSPDLSGQLTMPPMPMPSGPGILPGGIAPKLAGMERGGNTDDTGETVPIIIAGGEYVVHPDSVKMVGKGDLTRGHDHLDAFVKNVRTATAAKMQKLPGPKK